MPFGQLLGALGRLLAALGRLLGVFWALFGRLLGGLGHSRLPNAAQEAPGLNFGGCWERPGRVPEVRKPVFFEVFPNKSL